MIKIENLVHKYTIWKDENTKSHGGNPLYGEWITGTCPRCKQDVQLGMNYCSNCGQKLLWKEEK